MDYANLSTSERELLLKIAREAVEAAVCKQIPNEIELSDMPENLLIDRASFVTLMNNDRLRGCIGALEASQPLVFDVQDHAVAAATHDYRFQNVQPDEVEEIQIEISILTPMQKLEYDNPMDLARKIRPGIDGVTLMGNSRRATFLPQVWDKIPDPVEFLNHLCMKMGASADLWRSGYLDAYVYQVEEFKEE